MVKKVKKKKIKIIPCLILLLVLGFFYLMGLTIYNTPIKNIFISGNKLLTDQEIIDLADLTDYPRYYKYSKKEIAKKIEKNPLVEKVEIKHSFFNVIKINVKEHKILLYDYPSNTYIIENGEHLEANVAKNRGIPTLVNYISDEVYSRFIEKLNLIEDNIINQISEIKYDPSTYDSGRFFLSMNDGNYVYINIVNFKYLNLYNEIYPKFDGHIGILKLDSGYALASEYEIIK